MTNLSEVSFFPVNPKRWQGLLSALFPLLVTLVCLTVPSAGQEPQTRPSIGEEFASVISLLGASRETNHAAGFVVTDRFTPIIDRYSLVQFHDYIGARYKLTRITDWSGNYENVSIQDDELRNLDGRFLRYDRLRIIFKFDAKWSRIILFAADLVDRTT